MEWIDDEEDAADASPTMAELDSVERELVQGLRAQRGWDNVTRALGEPPADPALLPFWYACMYVRAD